MKRRFGTIPMTIGITQRPTSQFLKLKAGLQYEAINNYQSTNYSMKHNFQLSTFNIINF